MSDYIWSNYQRRNILKPLESGPMFVKTREKYGDRIFLIGSEEDLVNTMLTLLAEWNNCGWLPKTEWYFDGTYDAYFFKEMGFNHVWFEEHIGNKTDHTNHYMKKVAECGKGMKSNYDDNIKLLSEAKFYQDILTNGLANRAGQLYNLMAMLYWNEIPMFTLSEFDTI